MAHTIKDFHRLTPQTGMIWHCYFGGSASASCLLYSAYIPNKLLDLPCIIGFKDGRFPYQRIISWSKRTWWAVTKELGLDTTESQGRWSELLSNSLFLFLFLLRKIKKQGEKRKAEREDRITENTKERDTNINHVSLVD